MRWIVSLSVMSALMLAAPASGAATPRPVYFVHGLSLGTGTDCAMWGPLTKAFNTWKLKGRVALAKLQAGEVAFRTVGYYHGDKNCNTTIDASGDHSKVPGLQPPPAGVQPHRSGSHTANTSIEHLAYHLSWNIYNTYSSKGRTIDVVAHSLGGLMIRYALAATERGVADFPPYLRIEDVVTLGTPHGGWRGPIGAGVQVAEMKAGSSLLKALERNGFNPQGRGGTDWTTVGSDDDTVVAADRAVGTNRDRDPRSRYIGSRHKVWYTAVNDIEHSDYYKENPTTRSDAVAWIALAGAPFRSTTLRIVHPMRLTFLALGSANS